MVNYRCSACRFSFDTNRLPQICPFCSRKGTVSKEESAEDLVRNIDRFLRE